MLAAVSGIAIGHGFLEERHYENDGCCVNNNKKKGLVRDDIRARVDCNHVVVPSAIITAPYSNLCFC